MNTLCYICISQRERERGREGEGEKGERGHKNLTKWTANTGNRCE
ncbi:Uncharacterized protein BM_BM981 [Brugia malayi]|uniref:Uncharacterized protein n=1 Tax=Brugia malayi TaxID=6279 RepID=A0A4E9FS70_BRUMA|nr:Uncharacterized protein BM_BM981 [Brugia malayi]VIO99776.1 Uncharacterized protein BM_BM981 [Brugia malayi]